MTDKPRVNDNDLLDKGPSSASCTRDNRMSEALSRDLAGIIRAIPEEAFREPQNPLESMTYLERLRWLQQTAYFIWRHKGAALGKEGQDPSPVT